MSAWAGEDPEALELPASRLIIDLHTLTPRQRRVAEVIGKWIGIAVIYAIAGAILAGRGIAWVARRTWSWVRSARS